MATVVDAPQAPAASPPNPAHLTYEPGLDGLRGVAVMGVLFFHSGIAWATGGFLGVSTFFTLSGFLITTLLLRQHAARGSIDLRRFWSRRFRRLMPAALFALLLCVLYVAFAGEPFQYHRLRGDVIGALFYVENWRLVFTGQSYLSLFSAPSPVQHFWSLAIEEQFYLIFPLLAFGILAFGRGSKRLFAAALVVLAAGSFALLFLLYTPGADPSRVYYGSDTRALELIMGALLAIVFSSGGSRLLSRSNWIRVIVAALGVAALIATVVTWTVAKDTDSWLYRGGLAVYALGTVFIILAAITSGPVRMLLSFAPLRYIGRISYGVYLYHWPVFLWLSVGRTGVTGFALLFVRCAVTIGIAALSFRYLEQPIRSGKRLTGWHPWLVAPVAAIGLCVVLFAVTADPPKDRVILRAVSASGTTPPTLPPGTTARDVSRVMIVGDSVAQTLGRGLERWGPAHHVAVWNRGRYLCGVLNSGEVQIMYQGPSCNQWQSWKTDIGVFNPQVVLVLTTLWDVIPRRWEPGEPFLRPGNARYDDLFVAEYARAVDLLTSRGARVLIMAPPCTADSGVSGLLLYERQHLLPRVVARRPGVKVVDVTNRICPNGQYRSDPGGIPGGRPDGTHFSDASADWVAQFLMPKVTGATNAR